jgi:hypothetical protein
VPAEAAKSAAKEDSHLTEVRRQWLGCVVREVAIWRGIYVFLVVGCVLLVAHSAWALSSMEGWALCWALLVKSMCSVGIFLLVCLADKKHANAFASMTVATTGDSVAIVSNSVTMTNGERNLVLTADQTTERLKEQLIQSEERTTRRASRISFIVVASIRNWLSKRRI